MGTVYAATHLPTGYERAIKILHASFSMDARARERFEQEARIGARIHSDHVVQVVAAGIDGPTRTPWLAMELLEGQDLERHVQQRGAMALGDVAQVTGQVVHALSAAHDVNIVHRDVKPENVFLSRSRVVGVPFMVKILDFGIAKLRTRIRAATLAVGTPGYMAPEQSQSSADITPAADVWSLGLVVFRMLVGYPFWLATVEGSGMPRLWREMLVDPLPTATERASEFGRSGLLPEGFDDWFAACVEREPSLRFPDARAAGRALDKVLRRAGVNTVAPTAQLSKAIADALDTGDELDWDGFETHAPVRGASTEARDVPSFTQAQTTMPAQGSNSLAPKTPALTHRVSFREPGERVVASAPEGDTLLDVSLNAGIPHFHACGGNARCSTCRVVVLQGRDNLSPRPPLEQRIAERRQWPASTRLACQARVLGPCMVRRLVSDPNEANMADMRRSTQSRVASSCSANVLALRLDGIDEVLAEGFPDDAVHVLERAIAPLQELVAINGGRLAGIEGTTVVAAFEPDLEGMRRAVRVALRTPARIRALNPYVIKHFGAQVGVTVGVGTGTLLEATTPEASADPATRDRVLMGAAVRQAREACTLAHRGQVLAPVAAIEGLELELGAELHAQIGAKSVTFVEVLDFAKSDVVFLVQSSFDRLGGKAPAFAQDFYDDLFERHPAAIELFEHTDMARQQQMLMDTLALAVRGLDDFAAIEATVRELGQRHVDYGATLSDYKHVGGALLATLQRYLGEDFTPEVELAWREVYSTLVRTMTTSE